MTENKSQTGQAACFPCPLCGESSVVSFRAFVLRKYDVAYGLCEACGLLATEPPHWLDEAYRSPIGVADTGLVARNLANASLAASVCRLLGVANGTLVDVAGGYGLFTRLMRDSGFDCYTHDPLCTNVHALGFEPPAGCRSEMIFAFEAIEHIRTPLEFLENAFRTYGCRTALVSTQTFSGFPPPQTWWYYSFDGGQHVMLYQPRSVGVLAEKLKCRCYSLSPAHHLITDRTLHAATKLVLRSSVLRRFYSAIHRRLVPLQSKTFADSGLGSLVRGRKGTGG
ncbi:MAG: methyltransferase domain-containing protein [Planctomycetota bacterium]